MQRTGSSSYITRAEINGTDGQVCIEAYAFPSLMWISCVFSGSSKKPELQFSLATESVQEEMSTFTIQNNQVIHIHGLMKTEISCSLGHNHGPSVQEPDV
jgi:hypothetical protein